MTRSRLGPGFSAWLRDDPAVHRALRSGEEVEVELTSYAENDFLLDFLMSSGLWEILVSLRPRSLRKENGKPWRALNGLEVLRELAHVDRIAHCGRVISDTRLMLLAGFNAREIHRARRRDGLVVTPETLSNHLSRIAPRDAVASFYDHVELLRRRGWLGRGVYAADGHDITFPHARGWQGMGQVGSAHGYKLVLVTRVMPLPERIVAFALGPLPTSEHLLLRMALRALERRVGPLRRLIETLVLDRGYWGAQFLLGLRRRHGFHFVTRAQHEGLGCVKDADALVKDQEPLRVCEDRSRLGRIEVHLRGVDEVPLFDDDRHEVGTANIVVADELDLDGRPLLYEDGSPRRMHYVTDMPVEDDPYWPRGQYRHRWVVENEGFRNLTQRWSLDVPAGRNLAAIVARLVTVLILANAESVAAEVFPGPWQQERERLHMLGAPGLIGGRPAIAAYTEQGQLGLLSTEDYARLVAHRERQRLARELLAAHARGEDVQALLRRLGGEQREP